LAQVQGGGEGELHPSPVPHGRELAPLPGEASCLARRASYDEESLARSQRSSIDGGGRDSLVAGSNFNGLDTIRESETVYVPLDADLGLFESFYDLDARLAGRDFERKEQPDYVTLGDVQGEMEELKTDKEHDESINAEIKKSLEALTKNTVLPHREATYDLVGKPDVLARDIRSVKDPASASGAAVESTEIKVGDTVEYNTGKEWVAARVVAVNPKVKLTARRICEIENRLLTDSSLSSGGEYEGHSSKALFGDIPNGEHAAHVKRSLIRRYGKLKKISYDMTAVTMHQLDERMKILRKV